MSHGHPASRVGAQPAGAGRPGGQGRGLLCLTHVHVPGGLHHRGPLHGVHRGHHFAGEDGTLSWGDQTFQLKRPSVAHGHHFKR